MCTLPLALATGLAMLTSAGCGDPSLMANGNTGGNAGNGSGGSGGGFSLPEGGVGTGDGGPGAGGSGPSQDANCGIKRIPLEKRPADLLLVLDRSGSMVEQVAGKEKWTEVVGAVDLVVNRTQGAVAWGLKLFPTPNACSVPDGATVPVASMNHAAIMTSINGNRAVMNGGSTPTRVAVEKATAFLRSTPSTNNKHILLATDGEPNCVPGATNTRTEDRAGAVAAVAAASNAGIPTFVVGIATLGSSAHETLNQMADRGGRARSGAVKYYPVASRDELVAALETITGQIASCTFPLDPPPPVPENVAVEVDGARVARDQSQAQGWNSGPNNRSIVLYGAICDSVKAGAKNVQILYGCPGISIP
jgi:hypothetical protein